MRASNNIALKEWDVVVRNLAAGRQVLLLRKGGILDAGSEFQVEQPEFWLFPTFEHQSADQLQPAFRTQLRAAPDDEEVEIRFYAEVTDIVPVQNRDAVHALSTEYIWDAGYVDVRFDWSPERPLFALILRVHAAPEAAVLPVYREYAGCKSWVELDCELSTADVVPVLPDADFAARRRLILETLRR